MTSKLEKLPQSRIKLTIVADHTDLAHAADHAVKHLTGHAVVKGFRPGKAPMPMLVAQVGMGRLLNELVDHAIPEITQEIAIKEKLIVIENPAYTLEKLCELNEDGTVKAGSTLEFTVEADVAPEVTVGDYSKLKAKAIEVDKITDKEIDEFVDELAKRRAPFEPVERAAKKDDRLTIDFAGKRNGIPEERLASKDYLVILGTEVMIPGFEDELIGKKKGDKHTFEIAFPADYHAKDLAGQKVVFEVEVKEVAERKLPPIDEAFAKEFGQESVESLKKAIREEREFFAAEKAKDDTQALVLEEFEKLVTMEIPASLLEKEIDRQVDVMRQQVQQHGLKFDNYLDHLKKTEEQLRDEVKPTAEKAVKIGLGLGKVAEKEGIKDKDPAVKAIEKLVEIATTAK